MKPWSAAVVLISIGFLTIPVSAQNAWETLEVTGEPKPRHEAAFVEHEGELFLLGGRRIQTVSVLDPATMTWRQGAQPPKEVHHFQPVSFQGKIYILCAMTGGFPNEVGLERILIYDPGKDEWSWGDEIPEDRRRGAAGVVEVDGLFYVTGGIVNGHVGGYVAWTDRYDPKTGKWVKLADAPHQRDHFQAAYHAGKIYSAGGRTTSQATKQLFNLTVPEVDVYDIASGTWSVLAEDLPTPRAGNSTLALGDHIVVAGGESGTQKLAHNEVEAWDTGARRWLDYPSLNRGRHGTSLAIYQNYIYTCSGSGNKGGSPELISTERLKFPVAQAPEEKVSVAQVSTAHAFCSGCRE